MDDAVFDNLYAQSKKFLEFEKLLNSFVEDLTNALALLTQTHFYKDNPDTGLLNKIKKNRKNLKKVLQSQEIYKIYGYMICKEIQQIMNDFAESDNPQGSGLKYVKKEYPLFDQNWVEQQMEEHIKNNKLKTASEKNKLRLKLEKERARKEKHLEFEKAIHNELKKLVLQNCPRITDISGNGLRQIDYMLHAYMLKITESIRPIIED
jgi:hypothetical protein